MQSEKAGKYDVWSRSMPNMQQGAKQMITWFCKNCPANNLQDCGEWNDDSKLFPKIRQFHLGHTGWQQGKPEPPTRILTEIEQIFTDYFEDHIDEMFHNIAAWCKGDRKVCLIKEKWRWISQA